MPLDPAPAPDKAEPLVAAISVAAGVAILLIATGVIPTKLHAPPVVVGAVGIAFAAAGATLLLRDRPRLGRACAAAVASGLGVTFTWAAFTTQEGQITGGIPFLSPAATQILARILAALAAVFCFTMAARVARQAISR